MRSLSTKQYIYSERFKNVFRIKYIYLYILYGLMHSDILLVII